MTLAPKVILHSPVSDEGLLDAFVEQCLRDRVSLIAVVGPGCARLEELIDEIVVGDGADPDRFVCTTSHPDEPFEDVLNMVERWNPDSSDRFQEVRLQGFCNIGERTAARRLRLPPSQGFRIIQVRTGSSAGNDTIES